MAELTIQEFHRACQLIIDNREVKALNWCVDYAQYGLMIDDKREAQIQAIYIKSNMIYWRGSDAKAVRAIMTQVIEEWI